MPRYNATKVIPATEPLESRQLLSATLDGNGVLKVTGTSNADVVILSLNATGNRLVVTDNGANRSFDRAKVKAIRVEAGGGNDRVEIDQGYGQVRVPATLLGGDGHDRVYGGGSFDNIQGGAGNDVLRGQAGPDSIAGGSGHDDIDGGTGNDYLEGNDGQDEIDGFSGSDKLRGGGGDDSLDGEAGNDDVNGGSGDDEVEGGAGADSLFGSSGDDEFDVDEHREIRDLGFGTDAEEIDFEDAPAAVREATLERTDGEEPDEVLREFEDDDVTYEIEFTQDGVGNSLRIEPDGEIIEEEVEIDPVSLPIEVQDAIRRRFPGGTIEEAEFVLDEGEAGYEVDVLFRGRIHEVEIAPDGEIDEVEVSEPEFVRPEPAAFRDFETTGRNRYQVLEVGYRLNFRGVDDGEVEELSITVLDAIKTVDGVECRIIEERETADGELVEISRNYVAIDDVTKNVYYFGEDVDIYEDGEIVAHDGAWLSGVNGAKYGLLMPGRPRVGQVFAQENAPGVAQDQGRVVSTNETVRVPAGTFNNVLRIIETSPLEPGHESLKLHAPGVGLIQDGVLKLVSRSGPTG